MLTVLGLLAVVALIATNGYFVAAEFSFVAAHRSRFAEAADAGDRRSIRALEVLRRLSFMLSGAQLGITVTSLILGFIAQPTIGAALSPLLTAVGIPEAAVFGVSLTIAFILATFTQMIFGELAPKNLAIARSERVAGRLAGSMLIFLRVAGPFIKIFDSSANALLRLLRVEPVQELHLGVSTGELDLIVDTSAESGHLSAEQAALLARAIDFTELEASDAMVPWNRTVTILTTATAADLRALMSSAHSRFPVLDAEGGIVGIVHAKDLLRVPMHDYEDVLVGELLHEVLVVPEAAGLRSVLRELRSHSTEMAVVVDEYGGPAGVVTLEDLVEELVGDIADEYDAPFEEQPVETAPGVWTVPAGWRVDEIERVTEFRLPEGDYDTVAGLVLDRMERIPEVGDTVVVDDVLIEVLALEEWAITRLRLSVHSEDSAEQIPSDTTANMDAAEGEPS